MNKVAIPSGAIWAQPGRARPIRASPIRARPIRARPRKARPMRAQPMRAQGNTCGPTRPTHGKSEFTSCVTIAHPHSNNARSGKMPQLVPSCKQDSATRGKVGPTPQLICTWADARSGVNLNSCICEGKLGQLAQRLGRGLSSMLPRKARHERKACAVQA